MVAQKEEKWKRRFQEVSDEKEDSVKKLAELQEKVRTAYSLRAGNSELVLTALLFWFIEFFPFFLLFFFVLNFFGFDFVLNIRKLCPCYIN